MSPLLHHLDAFFPQDSVPAADSGIRHEKHMTGLTGLQLQHAAAEWMPFELATEPAGGRVPRRGEPLFGDASILEQA